MLGTKPNSFYDPNMKTGLGYQNPEHLKKAIQAQPKMYNGKYLKCDKLSINLPDYEETLEEAEESQLKMKDKMIQVNYVKLNSLYDTFVPQKELSTEHKYLSAPSTSNVTTKSSPKMSSSHPKEMPKASLLLKMFDNTENEIKNLDILIHQNLAFSIGTYIF
ncbi:hypothetical protein Tco_0885871 [Tanacetum coccineum]